MSTNLEQMRQYLTYTAAARHWERVGVDKRFGVCVPLFSLRSARDHGIGDVGDLFSLVDWCRSIGASVIQLLPINDMGLDSVPYAALSAFALDPVFIALDRLESVAPNPKLAKLGSELSKTLNGAKAVNYQWVRQEKMAFLLDVFKQDSSPDLAEKLAGFRKENDWLEDYLPYRVFKEREGYRSWEDWGHKYDNPESLSQVQTDQRFHFHLWLQWVAERQFSEAREYANQNGVLLKGDIPILVSRDSADVWRNRDFFKMEFVAGAPPDMYSETGQKWGFPTYNWETLAADDFRWWRSRLRYAQRFFDMYRIDHVVGFFRIWTIRDGAEDGREGWYEPWDEAVWGEHGRNLLQMMLESTHMLPLAEDLGTIPPVCRDTLRELGICGLKVQRWEKRWEQDNSFIDPAEYPALSVATVSTHDSETLSGWWEAYPSERQQLWETLGREGIAPSRLFPDIHRQILSWVAGGGATFNLFQLQELLEPFGLLPGHPADHRVNVPGTVGDTNWTWRCPVGLEELLHNHELARRIRETFKA